MKARKFFENILKDYYEVVKGKSSALKGGIVILINKDLDTFHISNFGEKIDDVYFENAVLSSGMLLEISKEQLASNFKYLEEELGEEEFEKYYNFLLQSESSIRGLVQEAYYTLRHPNGEEEDEDEEEEEEEQGRMVM